MSAEITAEAGRSLRTRRKIGAPFALLFVIAGGLTAYIVWLASSAPGSDEDIGTPLRVVITTLIVNGGLIALLMGLVGWRILAVMRSREAGSRLHLRFMSQFALAAAVPAVVVAFFFGVLMTRGVDGWFSQRIETVVENQAVMADALMGYQDEELNARIAVASLNLNQYIDDLRRNPASNEQLLRQVREASGVRAIHVIDRQGEIIAQAVGAGASPYVPPAPRYFVQADAGGDLPAVEDEEANLMHIMFPLEGTPRMYALVQAPMPEGLLTLLRESSDAVTQYRDVRDARGTVQAIFMTIYIEVALLVMLGALWLGMSLATSISTPVARLIEASNRVASGDLRARVGTESTLKEINVLSSSFNKMTSDLQQQTGALVGARAEAENRRTFIETVLAGVSAGVLGLDAEGRISVCNAQAGRLLGADESGLGGRPLASVAPELLDVAARALAGGGAEDEIDLLRDGETRRLRVRAGGSPRDGLVLTFDDITKLVSAQRNAAWRDVARRIAHEIKNPLTPIQLSAERLRRKYRKDVTEDVETFDRCTETIIRQVGDIGRMVDEFSAFARMPAPRYAACDAAELLREAVFARRVASPEIDIVLEDVLVGEGPVLCDERMLNQALGNILKNAAEAIGGRSHPDTGYKGRIVARVRREDDRIVYEIEDNGVGLPATDRERLTEPYVTTREKGTGLGLAIVRRILEDHGGTLSLRDAPGGGALVSLVLPQAGAPQTSPTFQSAQL